MTIANTTTAVTETAKENTGDDAKTTVERTTVADVRVSVSIYFYVRVVGSGFQVLDATLNRRADFLIVVLHAAANFGELTIRDFRTERRKGDGLSKILFVADVVVMQYPNRNIVVFNTHEHRPVFGDLRVGY